MPETLGYGVIGMRMRHSASMPRLGEHVLWCYVVLHGVTRYCMVLHVVTGYYRVSQGVTWWHITLQGVTGA